ncbi:WD40-repeat-containing domain protein [Lineolata rhizophorae]|uniref:Mitochondrial division protein 1 n=1 Tax=Lineolata rhizophorae TaxID=578093 RepID=A0A6A6P576_9PEZI|nr:WD40-repeat-containing domain protein [Lineolata rhizophorae]
MTHTNPTGHPPQSRHLEAFSRKVSATATHLIDNTGVSQHYANALGDLHRELRRPGMQRGVFAFAQTTPRDLVRSTLSVPEIQHRALSYVSDELLRNVPEGRNTYSLFEGFRATVEGAEDAPGQKALVGSEVEPEPKGSKGARQMRNRKRGLNHRLEMMGIRKNMCAAEITEIDTKIANLNKMRRIVLERLADLEGEEADLEHELLEVANKLEDLQEEGEDEDEAAAAGQKTPTTRGANGDNDADDDPASPGFMSESIYQKLPSSPRSKRRQRPGGAAGAHRARRVSTPILHTHMEPGTRIKELAAHTDLVTALDFDYPFGTMVTAALDDTVRVWDLHAGRCMGLLEGHLSSVRCLQVEGNIVATGSMDASIRLWDLSRAEYAPRDAPYRRRGRDGNNEDEEEEEEEVDEDDGLTFGNDEDAPPPPPPTSMQDCPLFALEAHVAEVTALHFRGETLVSGSADKTLRQWDLVKGRCVQTLDVLWAAAQASATLNTNSSTSSSGGGQWRNAGGRLPDASADFVGALQCFDAALACGTADGMVRLWDLRSGQVHRSLVGHTGPVSALQFDDVHLVTGSLDRSVRIWDLRTGSIFDAYAYDNPITSLMFDARRIVAAAGEDVVKVYDKADGRHWNCGPGVAPDAVEAGSIANVERVRLKEGFLVEGRKDGVVGVWSC